MSISIHLSREVDTAIEVKDYSSKNRSLFAIEVNDGDDQITFYLSREQLTTIAIQALDVVRNDDSPVVHFTTDEESTVSLSTFTDDSLAPVSAILPEVFVCDYCGAPVKSDDDLSGEGANEWWKHEDGYYMCSPGRPSTASGRSRMATVNGSRQVVHLTTDEESTVSLPTFTADSLAPVSAILPEVFLCDYCGAPVKSDDDLSGEGANEWWKHEDGWYMCSPGRPSTASGRSRIATVNGSRQVMVTRDGLNGSVA